MAATLSWDGNTTGLVSSLRQASQSISGFEAVAIAAASAMAAAITQGISLASELDHQVRVIQNLSGFDVETRKKVTESLTEISKARGIDAEAAARAAEAVHTQGVAAQFLGKEVDLAARITNAFGGAIENNARQLVKQSKIWGEVTDRVAVFGQMGARVGDTNLVKLLNTMALISVQAQRVNLDLKETNLILGFATRQFQTTERAGTSLQQLFAELAKEDSRVSEAIKEQYGQTFSSLVEEAESAFDVLDTLIEDFGQEAFTQLLGSVEAQQAFNVIANQLPEIKIEAGVSFGEAQQALNEALKNTDESSRTLINRVAQTYNDFVRDLVDVDPGSPLYDAMTSLIEVMENPEFRDAAQTLATALINSVTPMEALAIALAQVGELEIGGISGVDALLAIVGLSTAGGVIAGRRTSRQILAEGFARADSGRRLAQTNAASARRAYASGNLAVYGTTYGRGASPLLGGAGSAASPRLPPPQRIALSNARGASAGLLRGLSAYLGIEITSSALGLGSPTGSSLKKLRGETVPLEEEKFTDKVANVVGDAVSDVVGFFSGSSIFGGGGSARSRREAARRQEQEDKETAAMYLQMQEVYKVSNSLTMSQINAIERQIKVEETLTRDIQQLTMGMAEYSTQYDVSTKEFARLAKETFDKVFQQTDDDIQRGSLDLYTRTRRELSTADTYEMGAMLAHIMEESRQIGIELLSGVSTSRQEELLDELASLNNKFDDVVGNTEEIADNTAPAQDRNYIVVSTLSADYPRGVSP